MAESPDNPKSNVPEKPVSLVAMEKEFQQLGRDVKIRIPSGGPKAPRFVSASDLTFVYDTPPRGNRPMWLLGYRPKGYNAYQLPKVLVPVASYGDALGQLFVLPVPGNAEALANGANIFDQLSKASKRAGRTEVSNRFRDNWSRVLRGAGILIEELYPTGRAQSPSSSTLAIAENLEVVQSVNTKRGKVYRITKKGDKLIPIPPGKARAIQAAHSLDSGTAKRAMAATSLEETIDILKEAQGTQKARSKKLGAKARPLRRVSTKKLEELTASPDLPPEPPEGIQPLNRERAFEERRFAKQRGDDRPSFRGKKSASKKQRDLLFSQLAEVAKQLKPSPEDTPAESQLKSRLRERLKRDIPREVRGGTIQVMRGSGVEPEFLKPLETAGFLSKQDASRYIQPAMDVREILSLTPPPARKRQLRQGPYSKITRMLPQLPASATPDVTAEVLRRRLPATVTMEQAGQVNLGRAAAQRTTETAQKVQRKATRTREEGELLEIEKVLSKLAGGPGEGELSGGLSKVSNKARQNIRSAQVTPADEMAAIKLARSVGRFGTLEDAQVAQSNFIKSFMADVEQLRMQASDGNRSTAARAEREIRNLEKRLGVPISSDRATLRSKALSIYRRDVANRAVQALVAHHEDLRRMPGKEPRTVPDLEDTELLRKKDVTSLRSGGPEPILTEGELTQSARTGLSRVTGRPASPAPRGTASRIVENDGLPRTSIIGARVDPRGQVLTQMGPEVGGLTPARLPIPARGGIRVQNLETGSRVQPLRTFQPPRQFSVAELEALSNVEPIAAGPTSVAPHLRRELESEFIRSDLRESPLLRKTKPRKPRMRRSRGR
jgi:hypothetical protein